MNGRPAHPVRTSIRQTREVTRFAALWLTLIGPWSSACIEIDGGAAELSWSLRSQDGASIEACADVRVRVRAPVLGAAGRRSGSWEAAEMCRSGQQRDFPCGESSGITAFNLDPGPTAFWVEPVCIDDESADAGTYQVPPPIVRNVEEGQIVSLNSLLLVVNPADGECPPAGCTCIRP